MISETEFDSLSRQGYNRIALVEQAFADLETPLSLYLKLVGSRPHGFLLESVLGGERFGRYSFIGLPARAMIRAHGNLTELVEDGRVVESFSGSPLQFIEEYLRRFRVALHPGLPRFCGGLAGYFGYETIRCIEGRLAAKRKAGGIGTPDIALMHTQELAVIDNLSGRLYLIVYAEPGQRHAYRRAVERLEELRQALGRSVAAPVVRSSPPEPVERELTQPQFEEMVRRAKGYISAGDCMQVVLGHRLRKRYTQSPLSLYRALRSLNPSPYLYYYDMESFQIVGSSPEILVRQERDPQGRITATIRPIAGTRPRGNTPQADAANEAELLADPKERAEHVMLIDLARNDLGRMAEPGTVKVTQAFGIERYSHVMHIVSNVQATLRPGLTALDVLRASFPAGTLSGAPKIRAMEIIDELESSERGIYGGACGYISYAGDMDLAIAIRTGIIKDQMLYAQAGAGVVADSIAEMEWLEIEAKARAVLRAAELVEAGF